MSELSVTSSPMKRCQRWFQKTSSFRQLSARSVMGITPQDEVSLEEPSELKCPVTETSSTSGVARKKSSMAITTLEESLRRCKDKSSDVIPSEKLNESMRCSSEDDVECVFGPRRTSITWRQGDFAPTEITHDHRRVSFEKIEIRKYPLELGDNPSVSMGPPVTIGWDIMEQYHVSVDAFETERFPFRRDTRELLLPSSTREGLLCAAGYTQEEIDKTVKEVFLAKIGRHKTKQSLEKKKRVQLEEAVGIFERRVKKLLPFKSNRSMALTGASSVVPMLGTKHLTSFTIARQA